MRKIKIRVSVATKKLLRRETNNRELTKAKLSVMCDPSEGEKALATTIKKGITMKKKEKK